MRWKGAIFDWDGVVIHSAQLHLESWEALAKELEKDLPEDHFQKGFGKRNETIIPKILGWTVDPALIERWGKRKEEIYRQLARKLGIPLAPGAKSFLRLLSGRKVLSSIGTSTERENVKLALDQHRLESFFVGSICSEDVARGKPDPEVFLKAAQLMSLDPGQCVVFEDSRHGIEAAKRGGMKAVALTTSHPAESFSDLRPDLIFESLESIDPSAIEGLFI